MAKRLGGSLLGFGQENTPRDHSKGGKTDDTPKSHAAALSTATAVILDTCHSLWS
jgi:hypothetical protein